MVMKITSKNVAIVAVEVDGELSSVRLLPGEHKYNLDLHNERTYEDLRMLSEDMGIIEIEGGLPSKEALRVRQAKVEADKEKSRPEILKPGDDCSEAMEAIGAQEEKKKKAGEENCTGMATEEDDA
jgi:hypothetical protein